MRTPLFRLIVVIVVVAVLAVAWWLGSPLFLNRTVEENFPLSATATIPDGMSQQEVEQVMSGMAKVEMPASEEMPGAAAQPLALLSGSLRDADGFHKGSGRLTIYRLEDGSHILRIEDLDVTNGPDLHVLLANAAAPAGRSDLETGYTDLGPLKGNRGNQNYEIPADVDLDEIGSVVIYCMPFHVIFSIGALEPATADAAP